MNDVIIQARMNSSRLKGKVMQFVGGKPLLAYSIERSKKAKYIDKVIVATSTSEIDFPIVDWCQKNGIDYTRGSENDVLERYFQVASDFKSNTIVRVTADCPFVDPSVIDLFILTMKNFGADYVSNRFLKRTWPHGLDVEVFTYLALKTTHDKAETVYDREHVTPFIINHPELFKLIEIPYDKDLSKFRLTVDYKEDLDLVRVLIEQHNADKSSWREIINILKEHSEITNINKCWIETALSDYKPIVNKKISKLSIGTAQIGMNYGIANKTGKFSKDESLKTLTKAYEIGINSIDTAPVYGDSEDVVGDFIKTFTKKCQIVLTTKIPSIGKLNISKCDVHNLIISITNESKIKLRKKIDFLLLHDPNDYTNFKVEIDSAIDELKQTAIIEKFGLSLYEPDDLEIVFNNKTIDAVQIPISVFNQSFLKTGLLGKLKKRNVTIFARSIFLQGLFFLNEQDIIEKHPKARVFLQKLNNIAEENDLSICQLSVAFVNSIHEIDSFIFGLDNFEQLQTTKNAFNIQLSSLLFNVLIKQFSNVPKEVFDPRFW